MSSGVEIVTPEPLPELLPVVLLTELFNVPDSESDCGYDGYTCFVGGITGGFAGGANRFVGGFADGSITGAAALRAFAASETRVEILGRKGTMSERPFRGISDA